MGELNKKGQGDDRSLVLLKIKLRSNQSLVHILLRNLQGLGYKWEDSMIFYAIGLKNGKIDQANIKLELPDDNWFIVEGETKNLKSIYDEIYVDGPLKYEIEIFFENGMCQIKYYR